MLVLYMPTLRVNGLKFRSLVKMAHNGLQLTEGGDLTDKVT
jgi:hypothetical protein